MKKDNNLRKYEFVVNKEENYIYLADKKNMILLDFDNQLVHKYEKKLNGVELPLTIEEFGLVYQVIMNTTEGKYSE